MSFKKFKRTAIAEMREVESIEIDLFRMRGEMIFFLDSDKANKEPLRISISDEDLAAGSPKTGDMIARNPDNHRDQWLVAAEYFKKNFESMDSDDTENHNYVGGQTFGQAIALARTGKKVARKGWNGSGMFVYIVPAAIYPAQTEVAKKWIGENVSYREYWALKTAQGDVATWAPSGSDSLANDWIVID